MIARWSILICIYVIWNVVAYCSMNIWGWNRQWYDYGYWIGERLFVVTVFTTLLFYVEKKYKWVIKTLIGVAIWKLVYLLAVIFGVIQKNDLASLMGIGFILVVAVIIVKWEKLQRS